MEQSILKRNHITAQLNNYNKYPLTLVVAAMGYGKTTAVRDFLNRQKIKHAWLAVESDETSAQSVWHSLTTQLAGILPEIGLRLNALGFPADAPHRDRILDIIQDYTYMTDTVLVIDDYHSVRSPELDMLIERLIRRNIQGFHMVIITRTIPSFGIDELRLKGYCFQLKSSLFELTPGDIKEYFRISGFDITTAVTDQVYAVTEGWITAVCLIMQRYAETNTIDRGTDINTLIDTAIMARYTAEEAYLLMSLSVYSRFTPQQAEYLTDKKNASVMMQKLSRDNSLIHYDIHANKYILHNIFGGYLNELLHARFGKPELDNLYKRAGEWEIQNGNLLSGFKFFLKAAEYDRILTEFENPGISRVLDSATAEIVEIFRQIPDEAKYRYPVSFVKYADFYLVNVSMEGGVRLLDQIEEHYRDDKFISPALKKRIFGEITLVRSYTEFNDLHRMHLLHLKAFGLLEGRSSVANRFMMVTFGSPHVLYLYHREKGVLSEVVELFNHAFRYFCELSDGCGTGIEYLVKAEYCLETGDLTGAENYARKAVYKAETMDQVAVIICARFTMARLLAAHGKFASARTVINDLITSVAEYNNPVLDNTLELCSGYLGGIVGDKQAFAPWLKAGDMKHCKLFYQGIAFNYLVSARYVLLEENYVKLEVLCEGLHQQFSVFNNLLGHIHTYILNAAAKYNLYGISEAKKALLPALDLARADGLILPFAEYGAYISEILKTLHEENPEDEYLGRLAAETARYKANLQKIVREKPPARPLTVREKEVLRLVIEGKTNREIASSLFIAEVTVKKSITSVYRKLEVRGRAAAVRKVMELETETGSYNGGNCIL